MGRHQSSTSFRRRAVAGRPFLYCPGSRDWHHVGVWPFWSSGTVVDIGCGWAELLMRVIAAAPQCRGLGVDLDADMIEHGRHLAEQRGLTDRITLTAGDAQTSLPDVAEAVICIGASQVWNPPSEQNLPMNYARALTSIRAYVTRRARVAYGEAIWSAPPTLKRSRVHGHERVPAGGRV